MSEGTAVGTVGDVVVDNVFGLAVTDVELRDAARIALLAFALEKAAVAKKVLNFASSAASRTDVATGLLAAELRDVSREMRDRREVEEEARAEAGDAEDES